MKNEDDPCVCKKISEKYIFASEMAKKRVWIKKFINELGLVPSIINLISIYCDNNGVIAQANEPGLIKDPNTY